MAHADYDCCAVCDRKMGFMGLQAKSKTQICSTCIANLAEEGVVVHNVEELVEWIEGNDKETVKEVLNSVGFRFCYYINWVDETVRKKGLEEDEETRKIIDNSVYTWEV